MGWLTIAKAMAMGVTVCSNPGHSNNLNRAQTTRERYSIYPGAGTCETPDDSVDMRHGTLGRMAAHLVRRNVS